MSSYGEIHVLHFVELSSDFKNSKICFAKDIFNHLLKTTFLKGSVEAAKRFQKVRFSFMRQTCGRDYGQFG
jgi:hypothetical protein